MSTSANAVRIVSESAMPAGVRVSQLQPVLGSIISGFSFDGRPLNNEFRSALRDLLHNRGLVIFEPGTVNAENFTDFAGFLGEFFHYAGPHTPRAPENPDATMIDSSPLRPAETWTQLGPSSPVLTLMALAMSPLTM